jgi:hypothetical protein
MVKSADVSEVSYTFVTENDHLVNVVGEVRGWKLYESINPATASRIF